MSGHRADPLRIGDTIHDRYVVEDVIDRGGMGVVYLATHIELSVPVAVKVLRGELDQHEAAVDRMLNEARVVARLDSEHVARVTDAGRLPNGAPFIVMEHLVGEDLATSLEERGPLEIEEAVGFILQACDALARAHAAGIVHLDLKPANLFLAIRYDAVATIKVLDFGIAADLRASWDPKPHGLTGSPDYMSPEQVLLGGGLDERSDIWSLGVVLYELVTGHRPFEAGTAQEICARVLGQAPRPPRDLRPDLPEALEATILSCLDKNKASRPQTVASLAGALAAWGPEGARAAVRRMERVLGLATVLPETARREALADTLAEAAPSKVPSSPPVSLERPAQPTSTPTSRKLATLALATLTTAAGATAGYGLNEAAARADDWPTLTPTLGTPPERLPASASLSPEPCERSETPNDGPPALPPRPRPARPRPAHRLPATSASTTTAGNTTLANARTTGSTPTATTATTASAAPVAGPTVIAKAPAPPDEEHSATAVPSEPPERELEAADGDTFWTDVERGEPTVVEAVEAQR